MDTHGLARGEPMANQKKTKLTDNDCRALKCPKGKKNVSVYHPTVPGLILRCTRKGIKSWVFRFQYKNKRYEQKLGLYPKDLSLKDAVHLAYEWHASLRDGIDPRTNPALQEKNVSAVPMRSKRGPKFCELWPAFFEYKKRTIGEGTKDNYKKFYRELERYHRQHVYDIKVSEVKKHYSEITIDRGRSVGFAKDSLGLMGQCIRFYQMKGEEYPNPASVVLASLRNVTKRKRRRRTLTDKELRAVWFADFPRPDYRLAYRFMLLNATRLTETSCIEWDDLDLRKGVWTVRDDLSKNKHQHRIPLAPWTVQMLKEWKKESRLFLNKQHPENLNRPKGAPCRWFARFWKELSEHEQQQHIDKYVFPVLRYIGTKKDGGFNKGNISRTYSKVFQTWFDTQGWRENKNWTTFTRHDARRTVSQRMPGLFDENGDRLHTYATRATLNHRGARNETEQSYEPFDPANYYQEMKHGLRVWSEELRSIVDPTPIGTETGRKGLRLVG